RSRGLSEALSVSPTTLQVRRACCELRRFWCPRGSLRLWKKWLFSFENEPEPPAPCSAAHRCHGRNTRSQTPSLVALRLWVVARPVGSGVCNGGNNGLVYPAPDPA